MNPTRSTTGSATAEGKKQSPAMAGPAAFSSRPPLVDGLSGEDLHRCLHNEYDMGCAQPSQPPSQRGFMELSDQNYDHHLF